MKRFTICIVALCCVALLYGETEQGMFDGKGIPQARSTVPGHPNGQAYTFGISDEFSLLPDPDLILALEDVANTPIPDGPDIQVSLSTGQILGNDYQVGHKRIELGSVTLGDVPANTTFTVTNTGDQPLRFPDVPSIWLSGPNAEEFTVVTEEIPDMLPPGESLSVDLRFAPLGSGDRFATVHISSNDPDQALFSFAVRGIGNQVPKADAGDPITARKLDTVTLSALGSSDPDGDSVSLSYHWFYMSGPEEETPVLTPNASSETVTFVPTKTGTYVFEVSVSDGMSSATDQVTVTVTSRTRLVIGNVLATSDSWTEVDLPYAYESMVVVCTLQYDFDPNSPPLAARVADAYGSSFKVRLFSAGNEPASVQNVVVHYVAVEEGAYTVADDGVKMEARTYISSDVSAKGAMRSGSNHTYASNYSDPVVVGQIMSTNDANYQVFWAYGETPSTAPNSSSLHTGRHIGEDQNTLRLAETVGYIVMESGLNTCDGTRFFAGRTAKAVKGMAAGTNHREPIKTIVPAAAVLSNAGLIHDDGGYPVLNGSRALSEGHMNVAIEEDTLSDPDRAHPAENVAYIAFDSTQSALPVVADLSVETQADNDVSIKLVGKNLSSDAAWSVIDQPAHGTLSGTAPNLTYTPAIGFEGADTFTYSVADGGSVSGKAEVTVNVKPLNPFLLTGVISAGTDTWTNVALPRSFVSMVAVCTPAYNPVELPPMAVRVQNAFGNSFQVRLYRADNKSEPITNVPVHYVVIEEGQYTVDKHGATVEARRYMCPPQDGSLSWNLTEQTYGNSYRNPVVIGQILSTNSTEFQVFWATGGSPDRTPNGAALFTGRHIGEDTNMARSSEDIGYIVFEAGSGSLSGLGFEAGLIDHVTHNPSRHPVGSVRPSVALLSNAGMKGSNGCFPVLVDPVPTPGGFRLALTEDFLSDSERSHAGEHIAYVAIQSSESTQAYAIDQNFELLRPENPMELAQIAIELKALSVVQGDEWLVTRGPANGSLLGTAPQLAYRPNPGFEGTDTVTYRIRSPRGDSNTARVTIHVHSKPVNGAPVMESVWAGPDPDNLSSPAVLEVLAWDPDDDALTHKWECVDGPGHVTFKEASQIKSTPMQTLATGNSRTQAAFSESGDYKLKVTTSDSTNQHAVSYLSVKVNAPPKAVVALPAVVRDDQGFAYERLYMWLLLLGPSLAAAYFWLRRSLKHS